MIYIDEQLINDTLEKAALAADIELDAVLAKSRALRRLTLHEAAVLLCSNTPERLAKIYAAAAEVKNKIYGERVVLFAPLYFSNICANSCLYCAFRAPNKSVERKALSAAEVTAQAEWLLKRGHKRVLVVAGESDGKDGGVDYYIQSVRAVYAASYGSHSEHKVRRVNINCAPLSVTDFKKLKTSGIGTYQIFQETYHEDTYRRVHPSGPKSDPDNRLDAVNRAFLAGIDDVGIGVLYGLYDYRFETLAMLAHIEALERRFGVGPHTVSVPRLEPAPGSELASNPPYAVSDEDFKKTVAALRLAVPYTGIILSTRETPEMRDILFSLGVSQASAESRTSPGGYSSADNNASGGIQFSIGDQRSLDEVIGSLIDKGFIPSFCAACYRSERTGRAFMDIAKPGRIKGMCGLNALVTLKEYLDDFASADVKSRGYGLIETMKHKLDPGAKEKLAEYFCAIDSGSRDKYI